MKLPPAYNTRLLRLAAAEIERLQGETKLLPTWLCHAYDAGFTRGYAAYGAGKPVGDDYAKKREVALEVVRNG